ncbi:MAG: sel1 repeat family protein [Proteobacteria bacterium]|nr:sel1 repeat family protein [Pseudomonadota bacterium]MBU1139586.1 sel1 repeat family protein [Pseudomonadota bacterium]
MNQLNLPIVIFYFLLMALFPLQTLGAEDSYISEVRIFADAGDSESQFALALLYEYGGEGIMRDQEQSLIWFEKAGRADVAGACLYLGIKFENGSGVKQDYNKAARWYECAARQDWPAAQFFLARLYREGKGVQQSIIMALAWLGLAAEQAYPDSEEEYTKLLMTVDSLDINVLKEKQKCFLQEKRHCN